MKVNYSRILKIADELIEDLSLKGVTGGLALILLFTLLQVVLLATL